MNERATVPAGLARRGAPLGREPACRARQVVLSGLKGEDRVERSMEDHSLGCWQQDN